ncbi:nectin-3-like protein isoform X1 [Bufo gargarizans]|uniref:nectin-3-like protein isoform X1 n=1 Tax=Bufo gargarizans TaxID=30331 RepID=UPI001CF29F51|nr:nectin-3-like protein isoform X1 [Bufo gargarizans]
MRLLPQQSTLSESLVQELELTVGLEMSILLCVSLIMHVGYCQVRVNKVVYALLHSNVTLKCQADTQEEIKQTTWEVKVDGTSKTFLTYRNDTGSIFQMSYGGRVRFKGDGYKDGSIQILSVTLADEGVFKCVFTTYPSGTIEGEIQLQIFVLPTVRQELQQDVRTPCINMVTECLVSSAKPAAEIQWITRGVNYTSKENITIHTNKTMSKRSQLYMMTTPDLYDHEVLCLVSQPNIPFEYQGNITVKVTLTNIQFPPQMVQIEVLKKKDELQLLCKSDGNPRPKYNWKRRDAERSNIIPLDTHEMTSSTLNFTDEYTDGLYICEAANDVGLNEGYIYMYQKTSSSRLRTGMLISVLGFFLIANMCMCYMIILRLLHLKNDKFFSKSQSFEEHSEEKPERKRSRKWRKTSDEELENIGDTGLQESKPEEDTWSKKLEQGPSEPTEMSESGEQTSQLL